MTINRQGIGLSPNPKFAMIVHPAQLSTPWSQINSSMRRLRVDRVVIRDT
jgi:hypothetical protein